MKFLSSSVTISRVKSRESVKSKLFLMSVSFETTRDQAIDKWTLTELGTHSTCQSMLLVAMKKHGIFGKRRKQKGLSIVTKWIIFSRKEKLKNSQNWELTKMKIFDLIILWKLFIRCPELRAAKRELRKIGTLIKLLSIILITWKINWQRLSQN